ncbi:nitroreductase family deazaflavin-dependent oxidoreductase [Streptomyces sp. GKU 257-1]|nr:nitroreductase family deazaflavin-dependent oxidoreductase [Streptomyces sp. GKU 257-1]
MAGAGGKGSAAKFRAVTALQRHVVNPLSRRMPGQTLLETTGRSSGVPRRTPVGGAARGGGSGWCPKHGDRAQYVRNIRADPRVRVRVSGRWYTGTARLLADDDPYARLAALPRLNSAVVRAVGTDLLTVRIDLDAE